MNDRVSESRSLTAPDDWDAYYANRGGPSIAASAERPSVIESYLRETPGRIFELGCAQSPILARAARLGWHVGGIDFNAAAMAPLKAYVEKESPTGHDLLVGDIFTRENAALSGTYDLLVSSGFLEHFTDPGRVLARWAGIVKPQGRIISIIPNLFSVNARLLRKYDPPFWEQHVPYTPAEMDAFHLRAGLTPLRKAAYEGRYDVHMLIPWEKIRAHVGSDTLFKPVKYLACFGVEKVLRRFPARGVRLLNSRIVGVYARQGPIGPETSRAIADTRCP